MNTLRTSSLGSLKFLTTQRISSTAGLLLMYFTERLKNFQKKSIIFLIRLFWEFRCFSEDICKQRYPRCYLRNKGGLFSLVPCVLAEI